MSQFQTLIYQPSVALLPPPLHPSPPGVGAGELNRNKAWSLIENGWEQQSVNYNDVNHATVEKKQVRRFILFRSHRKSKVQVDGMVDAKYFNGVPSSDRAHYTFC